MSKITLLSHQLDITTFHAAFLKPIYNKFFNIEFYDSDKKYDKKSTIVLNGWQTNKSDNQWSRHLIDFKFIIDNLQELRQGSDVENKKYIICDKWFWVGEALDYMYHTYDTYVPNRTYKKTALMPMRLARHSRDILFQAVQPFLNDFIYSYVDKGIRLPDDRDNAFGDVEQRYFNPLWYDNTCFSLVSETMITSKEMFVTEKTFKTFAYSHPFMVFGIPETLKFLQNLGFETYENIFDERYDNITNYRERLNIIIDNIKSFTKTPYDALTLQKIEHNKNLFYNRDMIESIIIKEIVEPILEYAET